MKKTICVDIEDSLLRWIEKQIDKGKFESLNHAVESAILYRKRRFGKRRKRKIECAVCEKKFLRGWKPTFAMRGVDTKGYGICQKCLNEFLNEDYMKDMSEEEREEELRGIFLDHMI